MRKKVFIDTNVLLSGVFFSGNEAKLLSLMDIELYASDLVIDEAREVIKRKFETFGVESCKIAIEEMENAIIDFEEIITKKDYGHKINEARKMINKEKDSLILAAALAVKPDYFVTGDKDFNCAEVKNAIKVCRAKEVLVELGL